MSNYLNFVKQPNTDGRKTDVFFVLTKTEPPFKLGQISWYGPWRKYTFSPGINTVYDKGCLYEIADFTLNETNRYKNFREAIINKEQKVFFRHNIATLRQRRGLSQEMLAEDLGFTRSRIGSYEEGRSEADYITLVKISKYFGVPVDVLLTEKL